MKVTVYVMKFSELCDGISGIDCNGNRFGYAVDGVSAWYHENEYNKFIGSDYVSDGIELEYNGIQYVDHWFFVNESHESSVVGYSLLPIDNNGDVIFYIRGNHIDRVCTFDEMIDYLQNDIYFIN